MIADCLSSAICLTYHRLCFTITNMTKKNIFYRVLCGFFLGISVVAPGFSGSVIAITMGIYQDLLQVVSNPFKQLRKNIRFCFPLAIGVVISAVLFVLVFSRLFDLYEKLMYLLFAGLIFGNMPVIYSEIKKSSVKPHYIIGGIVALAAAVVFGGNITGLTDISASGSALNLPVFALSGFLGGVSLLIPGMSASIVLIIMGAYSSLLLYTNELLHLSFAYIVPLAVFIVCALFGLVLASHLIKHIFKKYPGFANSMVFGFMSGSLIALLLQGIKPNSGQYINWLFGAIALLVGLVVSVLFTLLARKSKTLE